MFPTLPSRAALLIVLTTFTAFERARAYDETYEQAPVNYSQTEPAGPVAELRRAFEDGRIRVDDKDERAVLLEVLEFLGIPVESQMLVFSKTSHQNPLISPATPRAIYFNDEVYLGWVRGGSIEIAQHAPGLGVTFHLLDHRAVGRPRFERPSSCLDCHAGSRVDNLPGLMVRSVYPAATGHPILSQGSFTTGHASPLVERWGGWYVTGRHGDARHLGNAIARETNNGATIDMEPGANVVDLSTLLDVEPYPTDGSDIVALMVLEHQVGMHNLFAQAATRVRVVMHRQRAWQLELGMDPGEELSGSSLTVVNGQAERILEHLLFRDEIRLPAGGVRGRADYQRAFHHNARRDPAGRSLKDFDLQSRLFRWRCSYLIYSAAFEDLPGALKDRVYERLLEVLDGRDTSGRFEHLDAAERAVIKTILLETKDDLPAAWRNGA